MNHITLNTGNSEPFLSPSLFTVDSLKEGALPEPYDRYCINTLFADAGWFYFDLALDGEHITANMVCYSEGCGDVNWGQITSLYLQIYGSIPPVPASSPKTSWLATVVLPIPAVFKTQMVAQVEQAIALSGTKESLRKNHD
jgi:hypothetical protein